MKNEKLLLKVRRGSASIPQDFSVRKLSCFDFFTSTRSFIEYNFSDAISIELPKNPSAILHISPRGFAAFLRLLLSEIYENSQACAKIYSSDKEIFVSVINSCGFKSRKMLIELAERSGFSFAEEGEALIFRTPITLSQELFVFANTDLELINYLYEAFLHE